MYNSKNSIFKMLFFIVVPCAVVTYTPIFRELALYREALVRHGELWRLLTTSFVHINTLHLIQNLIGAFLIAEIFVTLQNPRYFIVRILTCSFFTSLSILWFEPDVAWYCGMSGPLHALFTWSALEYSIAENSIVRIQANSLSNNTIGYIALILVVCKLIFEYEQGRPIIQVHDYAYPVLTMSHVYGAVIGVCLAGCSWFYHMLIGAHDRRQPN